MKYKSFFWQLIICLVIGGVFSFIYFYNHAFGTWGDDSAGYIYTWGRMQNQQPLVYQDSLTKQALDFFQVEKQARFAAPTHQEIISPSGYLASKYPIGLSILMYLISQISGHDYFIYYLIPALAVLCLLLVYLISVQLFQHLKFHKLLAILPALMLGLSIVFYEYTVAQPMRDIAALFFILASFYFVQLAVKAKIANKNLIFYLLLVLAVFSFGYSINIRETSFIMAPAYLILLWQTINKADERKKKIKYILKISVLSFFVLIIALLPSIINSVDISKYKEKFKKKDITSVAITSNFDHITSFSVDNLFHNNGKFKPGKGGLAYYWQIMNEITPWPAFMAFAALGFYFLFKKNKLLSLSLLYWFLSVLAIFALWINPYNRYIIPLFPVLCILAVYGLTMFCNKVLPIFFNNKKIIYLVMILIAASLVISYEPVISEINKDMRGLNEDGERILIYKAISRADLNNLKQIGDNIKKENADKKPLVVFSGSWQHGISETFSAHNNIQAIRMPLEQNRYNFDEEKVKEFFNNSIINNYHVYIWVDKTSDTKVWDLIKLYNYQLKEKYYFSFEDQVYIYELTKKN